MAGLEPAAWVRWRDQSMSPSVSISKLRQRHDRQARRRRRAQRRPQARSPGRRCRCRLAVHAQADAAHQVRRGVHDHLGTLAAILRIPEAEAVNCVVGEVLICAGIGRRGRGRGSGRGRQPRTGRATSSSAESAPPADIVTLDRVINAIRIWTRLSVEHARRLYGLVYPRDTRIVRLVVFALSLRRKPVRGFIHPVDTIERVVRENGLNPHLSRRVRRVWQADHREPVRSARPVAVFRVTAPTRW